MPYGHRRETNGTWTVFDTHSGRPAGPGFVPATNLSEVDAKDVASVLNRNTVGSPARLHRYAIQGLPGRH